MVPLYRDKRECKFTLSFLYWESNTVKKESLLVPLPYILVQLLTVLLQSSAESQTRGIGLWNMFD